jgi:hypothetical protein
VFCQVKDERNACGLPPRSHSYIIIIYANAASPGSAAPQPATWDSLCQQPQSTLTRTKLNFRHCVHHNPDTGDL